MFLGLRRVLYFSFRHCRSMASRRPACRIARLFGTPRPGLSGPAASAVQWHTASMPDAPADAPSAPAGRSGWLVACLCAAWCRTCDDYRNVMADAARAHPALHFAWVDIEDHADALDDSEGAAEDIENFPTLLLARDGVPHFFGTLLPHAGVLPRLLTQALAGELPPLADATARRMAQAVRQLVTAEPDEVRVTPA